MAPPLLLLVDPEEKACINLGASTMAYFWASDEVKMDLASSRELHSRRKNRAESGGSPVPKSRSNSKARNILPCNSGSEDCRRSKSQVISSDLSKSVRLEGSAFAPTTVEESNVISNLSMLCDSRTSRHRSPSSVPSILAANWASESSR